MTVVDNVTAGSKLKYTVAARESAAKKGTAMKSGKFPIRNARELAAALRRRHQTTESARAVNAHIRKRAKALGVKLNVKLSSGDVIEFGDEVRRARAQRKG